MPVERDDMMSWQVLELQSQADLDFNSSSSIYWSGPESWDNLCDFQLLDVKNGLIVNYLMTGAQQYLLNECREDYMTQCMPKLSGTLGKLKTYNFYYMDYITQFYIDWHHDHIHLFKNQPCTHLPSNENSNSLS